MGDASKRPGGEQTDEREILDLYLACSKSAIGETSARYGHYCTRIAITILHNREDADECVNDTFLHAWNAIPPQRPRTLSTFLGRITRNLSLDRYKARNAQKRGGETALLLCELEECIPSGGSVEDEVEADTVTVASNASKPMLLRWAQIAAAVCLIIVLAVYTLPMLTQQPADPSTITPPGGGEMSAIIPRWNEMTMT